jgi:IS30 family transposase
MLAQGQSETEIANLLGVHVSTINRDFKVLGWMRLDEKLGVYTNMETGTMEFVLWSRKKLRGSIAIEGM